MSRWDMAKGAARRAVSLSREQIIEVTIELLDIHGEHGLTFRALSERLATGPGAIYWHVANKGELISAACDTVVARTMAEIPKDPSPGAAIRAIALAVFDLIDTHPWVGTAIILAPGMAPVVRILEPLGQQVRRLGVDEPAQWAAVSALLNYILGMGSQNAAHAQIARQRALVRTEFLTAVATAWRQLDPTNYPFTRTVADQLVAHDDRADFLVGVDLILAGLGVSRQS